eukprot:TRINITY_DN8591_c0_g2_i1.p1 TRINITY_DN8591_c0_g2~~TRINITY_DN8591_c0_g2_i1.p1  ORF type:complete len:358 (+),score=57.99 TRINITY_DN8591_c0_g2_i1:53-1126(+)
MESAAICRIGVIADVQWCDIDDGWNYAKTERRCYRGALKALENAGQWWNDGPELHALAQLGDLIDGQCKKNGLSEHCFQKAVDALELIRVPEMGLLNLVGNHELYNFSLDQLAGPLRTRRDGKDYYCQVPTPGLRLLVLNGYEQAVIGFEKGDPRFDEALKILKQRNPNDVERPGDFTKGLKGTDRRFVPYNGAFGPDQLAWFREQLHSAEKCGDKVIVLSHLLLEVPLPRSEEPDGPSTMAFDYDEVANAINSKPGVVIACFSGHDHKGGYNFVDGVHHITFQSPLNKGDQGSAFGRVDVHHDRLVVWTPCVADLLHNTALNGREVISRKRETSGAESHEEGVIFRYPDSVSLAPP